VKASNGSAEISWLHEKSRNGILSDEDLKGKGKMTTVTVQRSGVDFN